MILNNSNTSKPSTESVKKKVILFIVAHTDDEALGLGGTIAKHAESNELVFGISMTDGVSARDDSSLIKKEQRLKLAKKSAEILGFNWIKHGAFPDNKMDSIPLLDVIKFIESVKLDLKPHIIYTHSPSDLNKDHRIVYEATLTAFRPQPFESWREIRTFEVPSATDYGFDYFSNSFSPNLFIDISKTMQKKLLALDQYKQEMREPPHTRSYEGISNLAKFRGFQCGLNFAEAFKIINKIER